MPLSWMTIIESVDCEYHEVYAAMPASYIAQHCISVACLDQTDSVLP